MQMDLDKRRAVLRIVGWPKDAVGVSGGVEWKVSV